MSHTTADQGATARNVAMLAVVVLLAMSLWFSASAVVPQLTAEWGLSATAQGWMTMSVQLGFVFGALGGAVLNIADRMPAPRLIALAALLGAVFNALIPLVSAGPLSAIALRFLTGVCLAGVYPPGMKVMASWGRTNRGLLIGILVGALTVGSGVPHLLNALSSGGTGIPPWRTVMLATSAQAALGAVLAVAAVRTGPFVLPARRFNWRFAVRGLTHRPTRLANIGYMGHMWEIYAMWAWAPILLLMAYERAGWSADAARLAGFGIFAVGGAACVLAGRWADRFGRERVTFAALMVSGSCCLLAGLLFSSPLALTALCLVWGFAVVADSAQFSALVSELGGDDHVGTNLQMQTSLGFLTTMITLQLVPLAVDAWGVEWAFTMLALGPVVGGWAMRSLAKMRAESGDQLPE